MRLFILLIFCFLSFQSIPAYPYSKGSQEIFIAKNAPGVRTDLLKNIQEVIEKSIANEEYPGAVVVIGHQNQVIYKGVFGNQRLVPDVSPMQFNTIFDIASLTKVVATTPAIMQLVEEGKIDLDGKVSTYWPEFGAHGKDLITIRQLLTHTSSLPNVDLPQGKTKGLNRIANLKIPHKPGTEFLYSDMNFVVLAYLVEKVSGESFDHYVQTHILKPLGMSQTFFVPPSSLKEKIAPTTLENHKLRWGKVQDQTAENLGGIAGHAGLFSTAKDLSIYAQSLLDGGRLPQAYHHHTHFLGPLTISKMISQQTPKDITDTRALGWDLDSEYSSRGVLFPIYSFGHTGWTGTSLWLDPATRTWLIILTNRVHPKPKSKNQLVKDRRIIANIVSASIIDRVVKQNINTSQAELKRAFQS